MLLMQSRDKEEIFEATHLQFCTLQQVITNNKIKL